MNLRLLTVCGSLQRVSANRAALDVATAAATGAGAVVGAYDRLAEIPAFDPDHEDDPGGVVADWRQRVVDADVVLVAAPEYAGGIAGAVKNAFDWLVGSGVTYRKPFAVISAGTSGGLHARRALAQTLTWQGAYVVAELGISAPRTKSDASGRITDAATLAAIDSVAHVLLAAAQATADERAELARHVVGALGVPVEHVAPA
jgi:chromate reductase, NAD(P)H dehydrogenase (quinone)